MSTVNDDGAAAVGPDDIDLIEFHDRLSTAEIVHCENLGICAAGRRPTDRRRGDGAGGPATGQRLGRSAVERASARRNRDREHLPGGDAPAG